MSSRESIIKIPISSLRKVDDLLGLKIGTFEKKIKKIEELDETTLDTLALLCDLDLSKQLIEGIERCKKGEGFPRESIWSEEDEV